MEKFERNIYESIVGSVIKPPTREDRIRLKKYAALQRRKKTLLAMKKLARPRDRKKIVALIEELNRRPQARVRISGPSRTKPRLPKRKRPARP